MLAKSVNNASHQHQKSQSSAKNVMLAFCPLYIEYFFLADLKKTISFVGSRRSLVGSVLAY